jgi:transposase
LGRPKADSEAQGAFEAVLDMNTGAQWHMLRQPYPNYKTAHRRFQHWRREGVLRNVLADLANALCVNNAGSMKRNALSTRCVFRLRVAVLRSGRRDAVKA